MSASNSTNRRWFYLLLVPLAGAVDSALATLGRRGGVGLASAVTVPREIMRSAWADSAQLRLQQ